MSSKTATENQQHVSGLCAEGRFLSYGAERLCLAAAGDTGDIYHLATEDS